MKKFLAPFICIFLGSHYWGLAGTKEEIVRLQSDVLQLGNQVRLLQKRFEDDHSILQSLLEQLNDQVARSNVAAEAIAEAMRGQTADVETSLAQVRQDIQKLSIKWDDTNNRIAALQEGLRESRLRLNSLRQIPSALDGGEVIAPDQVYNAAYNDYLMGNYDLAIAGFTDFLSTYPESELTDNALYYMGVAYQSQRQYERAIQAFDQVINLYPKADKTPIAYYKKARALQELQKNLEAVQVLKRLLIVFPDSQEATLAKEELEALGVE